MKIESVHLRTFKRFTDLTISGIPEMAKLVVTVGQNGSGKSSLFEGFNYYLSRTKDSYLYEKSYHAKMQQADGLPLTNTSLFDNWHSFQSQITISFHGQNWHLSDPAFLNPKNQKAFYIRSSYRNESDFQMAVLKRNDAILLDANRPTYLISPDARVSDNYQRIAAAAVSEIFEDNEANPTRNEIRERLIGDVRTSLLNVLPGLELLGPGDPLSDGTFFFRKGEATGWRYKNLSGGEKAAFDLLLDFIIKKEKFNDTVFCIDEPELHMSTSIQASLLTELYNLIPENCQLWISTHSIGMMRQAKEISNNNPGSVVFLDFNGCDFDKAVIIEPAVTDRAFWKKTFAVAIGDLTDLIAPSHIIYCEGDRQGTRNPQFDAKCLNKIFAQEFPDTEFVSVGSSTEILTNGLLITSVLEQVLSSVKSTKLLDRDDLDPETVAAHRKRGVRILSKRHIESYLYADEILTALCISCGLPEKIDAVHAAKMECVARATARANPPDDVKSASGEIYNDVKKILGLTQCGNTAAEFCVATLVPLVLPNTNIYREMKQDIFGSQP